MQFGVLMGAVDLFDATAFGISTPEAAMLDPQQRLLLEAAAEALQTADSSAFGVHSALGNRTAAFVGISSMDYNKVCIIVLCARLS